MDDTPTEAELDQALDIVRRSGGIVGRLLIITNRLREQLRALEARISDQDNRIAGLEQNVRYLTDLLGERRGEPS